MLTPDCKADNGSHELAVVKREQAPNMPINKLKRIARQCSARQPLDSELATWLASSIRRFLERECSSMNEAFELHFPQGGIPWWRESANRSRDASLRALAAEFYSESSVTAKARIICTLTERYAATAWRHDRYRSYLPSTYAGTVKEYIWRAFKSGAQMPLGERQLRNILEG